MNGADVFDKLSKMSVEQRKSCDFWFITDRGLINNFMDGLENDFELHPIEWQAIEKDLTSDVLCKMYREIEDELNEMDAYSAIWDDYAGLITHKLEQFIIRTAKCKGIKVPYNL